MGANLGGMQRSVTSHSPAGLSSGVSQHSRGRALRSTAVPVLPVLRAFADGFGGGVAGGLIYCLGVAYFDPGGFALAWMRALALAFIFGGFEVWWATRKPTIRSVRIGLLWTLTASLFVLWVLGATSTPSGAEAPTHFTPSRALVL